jgi:hypothetical protein
MHLVVCPSVSRFCVQSSGRILKLRGRNVKQNEMMCKVEGLTFLRSRSHIVTIVLYKKTLLSLIMVKADTTMPGVKKFDL